MFVDMLGEDLMALVQSTISKNIPPFEPKGRPNNLNVFIFNVVSVGFRCWKQDLSYFSGGDIQEKYQKFIRSKFQEIPRELSF